MTIAVKVLACKEGKSVITAQGIYKLTQHAHFSLLSSTINYFSQRDFTFVSFRDK